MKKLLFILLFSAFYLSGFCQSWTKEQLLAANTAKDISYLSDVEKDAIMYINLARLYPKKFAKLEVENYIGPAKFGDYLKDSKYIQSLITDLNSGKEEKALVFDKALYENAKCFAEESGNKGQIGHERENCPKGNYAECCSYGMETGKDIAMQWLIDHDVASLGHRKNCLNNSYTKIGISVHSHKTWGTCAVADIIW